jgi:hypothetical protein
MNPKVEKVDPTDDYKLIVTFTNGEVRQFDVKPYLDKGIFTELKDPSYFRSVRAVAGSIEWSHQQDFSFDTLYLASTPVIHDVAHDAPAVDAAA